MNNSLHKDYKNIDVYRIVDYLYTSFLIVENMINNEKTFIVLGFESIFFG